MKRIISTMLALLPSVSDAAPELPLAQGGYATDERICADPLDFEHRIVIQWVNNGLTIKPIRDTGAACRVEQWQVNGQTFSGRGACEIKGMGPDADYAFSYRVLNRRSFVAEGKTYRLCRR